MRLDLQLSSALAAGKFAGQISRRIGIGGGTTLPGSVAARLDPNALAKLAGRLARGSIVVTGTNGKTTTTRLISAILAAGGLRPIHNRAGANLLSGLTAALVNRASVVGSVPGEVGLFEVDEAVLPDAIARIRPRVLLVTNLFRDQLDRYGEVDYLAGVWRAAVAKLPADSTLVLNADDPLVASLGPDAPCRVVYFGIDDSRLGDSVLEHAADARRCHACGAPYDYAVAYYGHVGVYRCPGCGRARPVPDVSARTVTLDGLAGAALTLATPQGDIALRIRLPGVYNVYNALAATAVGLAFGVPVAPLTAAVEGFVAAFGRVERVAVGDRTIFLALVKNPVGFNQVIRTVFPASAAAEPRNALIYINDLFADGTDISWLWDVDFERLAGTAGFVLTSGTRAEDMLVRLKYAGVDAARLDLVKDVEAALRAGLDRTPVGGTLYVLPTYTAMLDVRAVLSRWGCVERFWEN